MNIYNVLFLYYYIMQLTELQKQIMQLWADKSLSFGCIVYSKEYMRYLRTDPWEFLWEVATCLKFDDKICWVAWFKTNNDFTIWHPITYSRLCYLYRSQKRKSKIFMDLTDKFIDNPELYNQSILEWSDEVLNLVRDFLLSIQ